MDRYSDKGPTPSDIKKIPKRQTAVALKDGTDKGEVPVIAAAGREKIAEKILEIAFANGIKVREDSALAEMLALSSLIPLSPPKPSWR